MRLSRTLVVLALIACAVSAQASVFVGVVTCDGIVLAADSRLNRVTAEGDHQVMGDNEVKLVAVQNRFLVAMGGINRPGGRPAWRRVEDVGAKVSETASYNEFIQALLAELSPFYDLEKDGERALTLFVAGYDGGVGKLTEALVPSGKINPLHTTAATGMAWAGDGGIVLNRVIIGADQRLVDDPANDDERKNALRKYEFTLALDQIALPEAVDLAIESVRSCIAWSRFVKGTRDEPEHFHPTVGGPIDAAVLTETGVRWVQRKEIYTGEPVSFGSAK